MRDPEMLWLLGVTLAALLAGTLAGAYLERRGGSEKVQRLAANLNARMRAWWVMTGFFVAAVWLGHLGSTILFAISSFMAMREFITLAPTRRGDHRSLAWVFFLVIPMQYYLVAVQSYPLFAIFIPVYAFILIPAQSVLAGETERFLERSAKIQWGLMTCVYFISHVPALLMLDLRDYAGQNAKLLFVFMLLVELNDVFQYVWGNLLGRTKVMPTVSPGKTWAGFVGGLLSTAALGAALWFATPFEPWAAAVIAALVAFVGFLGDVTMSAVKRDIGVKDFSAALPGHGGFLDRLDSLVFAAPIFFHLVRYYYSA